MSGDGSTTRQIFDITNGSAHQFEFSQLMIHLTDGGVMDDGMFGSIAGGLDNGVVLRKKNADGTYHNLWTARTNGELGHIAFDKVYDDKGPAGIYGLTVRTVFTNLGSTMLLDEGEKLELIVQDDLTDLSTFKIMAEGRFIE